MGLLRLKMLLRTTKMGFFIDHIHTDAAGENHSGSIHYLFLKMHQSMVLCNINAKS